MKTNHEAAKELDMFEKKFKTSQSALEKLGMDAKTLGTVADNQEA